MRFTQRDRSTPESVFWTNFIVGTIFSFMAIMVSLFTTYSQECKNKLKWIGALFGALGGFFIMGSIICFVSASLIMRISGMVLMICGIIYIYVINKNIKKIYNMAGYYPTNHKKIINEVVQELSNEDYQLRYNIEYGALRSLALQMPDDFKEHLLSKNEELIDILMGLYKDMKTPITREDFGVYGRSNGDEYNVVITLPKTTATALCNMIGIKVNQKRFFALTASNLVEWKGLENPTRSYCVYNGNTKEDLLHFLEREDIK